MRANDLRIGNYVKDRIHREVTVVEIRPEHLIFNLSNGNKIKHHIKTFEPIPLTEDWLLSFGFDKGEDIVGACFYIEQESSVNDFCIHLDKGKYKDFLNDIFITYVHQLQNLYFALTGKELKKI